MVVRCPKAGIAVSLQVEELSPGVDGEWTHMAGAVRGTEGGHWLREMGTCSGGRS